MNDDTTTEDIPQPYDLPYMAWTLLANVSEGDWTKQTPEWQGAVVRWRDEFHAWLADGTTPTEPALNGLEPGEIVAVPADLRNDPNGVRWEAQHPIRAWMPVGWQGFDAYPFARWVCRPITEEGPS